MNKSFNIRTFFFALAVLTASMITIPALADEYSDVYQLVHTGKLGDALTRVDKFLADKPRDPQMRFLKGVIQRDMGKTQDAMNTFTKLTEDYPELPEPYNNLAVLYASQGQYDKARPALEMAIRTNPSYATAHENLGDVYAKLASQAYSKALQLDSNNSGAAPKLALIRELFTPNSGKGQKPSTAPTPATTAPTPATATSAGPITPAAPATSSPAPAPASVTAAAPAATVQADKSANKDSKEVEAAVQAWAKAWSGKDVNGYLAAYGKDFKTPAGMSRSAWETERRQRINGKSSISVKIENLSVTVNGNQATAKFKQKYRADGLDVSSRKTLELSKSADHWRIVRESVAN